jgi:hypothetical protein
VVERRRHPRRPYNVRIRWQRVRDDAAAPAPIATGSSHETSTTRDISNGGLTFVAKEPLEVGAPLALELDREFGGPPLSALGEVVRCERDQRDEEGFLVGVKLTWIECSQPERALGLSPESAWTLL